MRVEYISPFVEGSINTVKDLLNITAEIGELSARPQVFTSQQVNLVFGVTGEVQGHIILGMSVIAADKIASQILGTTVVTFDQVAASAIAELGQRIAADSLRLLEDQGFRCQATPPTIVKGSNCKISTLDVPSLVIPLVLTGIGRFEINVSLAAAEPVAA